MITSREGRELIIKHEGFRNIFYICPAGHKTTGIGHKLTKKELTQKYIELSMPEWSRTYTIDWTLNISSIEVECLFTQDLRHFEYFVNTFIVSCNPGMKQHQFDALISFYFNIGTDRGRNSDSYDLLRQKKLDEAMHVVLKWHNINGELSTGLLNRRLNEIAFFYGFDYDRDYWEGLKKKIIDEKS